MTNIENFKSQLSLVYQQLEVCHQFIVNPIKKNEYENVIMKLRLLYESVSSPNPFYLASQKSNSSTALSDLSVYSKSRLPQSTKSRIDDIRSYATQQGLDVSRALSHVDLADRSTNTATIIAYANQLQRGAIDSVGYTDGTRKQIMDRIRQYVSQQIPKPELIEPVSEQIFQDAYHQRK